MGYKGISVMNAGYFYCPYVPLHDVEEVLSEGKTNQSEPPIDTASIERFYELASMWVAETDGVGCFDDWLKERGLEQSGER
jgi:hypothetical protein